MKLFFKLIIDYVKGKKSFLAENLFKDKKVLDVGCGFGDFLKYNSSNFEGVDINKEALAYCKSKGYNVKNASVNKLPYKDNSFEGVVCLQVIEHLYPEVAYEMIKEMFRILKPNGLIAISTEMATKKVWDTFSHTRPYPPKALYKLISPNGQETFLKIHAADVYGIYYAGYNFKRFKFLNILSTIIANITPFNRYNYTLILRKI